MEAIANIAESHESTRETPVDASCRAGEAASGICASQWENTVQVKCEPGALQVSARVRQW